VEDVTKLIQYVLEEIEKLAGCYPGLMKEVEKIRGNLPKLLSFIGRLERTPRRVQSSNTAAPQHTLHTTAFWLPHRTANLKFVRVKKNLCLKALGREI